MAMPRKIPVEFGLAFPYGAYAVGEVQPVRDYDKSTRERVVQAADLGHGVCLSGPWRSSTAIPRPRSRTARCR